MLTRAVQRFFKPRIGELDPTGMHPKEWDALFELFTGKYYKPNNGLVVFGSYNSEFKAYLFSMRGFCRAFNHYHCK